MAGNGNSFPRSILTLLINKTFERGKWEHFPISFPTSIGENILWENRLTVPAGNKNPVDVKGYNRLNFLHRHNHIHFQSAGSSFFSFALTTLFRIRFLLFLNLFNPQIASFPRPFRAESPTIDDPVAEATGYTPIPLREIL